MKIKNILSALIALFFTASCSNGTAEQITYVSAKESEKMIKSDTSVVVLDVRSEGEFASGHIRNALNIPVDALESRIGELAKYQQRTIIAVCRTDRRSSMAADILTKKGFKVNVIKGGMNAWTDNRLPIVTQ